MRHITTFIAILCYMGALIGASGCTTKEVRLADQMRDMSPCCTRFADIHYHPLAAKSSAHATIDETAPLYVFKEGKSFFQAYRLPRDADVVGVKSYYDPEALISYIFRPVVTLLRDDYSVSRAVRPSLRRAPHGERPMYVDTEIQIRPDERYMIVHTDDHSYGDAFFHFYPKERVTPKEQCPDPRVAAALGGALGAVSASTCGDTGKDIPYGVIGEIGVSVR